MHNPCAGRSRHDWGRVTDPQGAIIPGAAVTVISKDTNVQRSTVTTDRGLWQIQALLPGNYSFRIESAGFRVEQRANVTLQAADVKQFDMQMTVGSESQTVTVSAETPLIDTTAATSGTVVTQRELEDLSSQSHVPTLFATLAPGVVQRDQGSNVVRGWSNDGASQFTANGGRNVTPSNNFQLDGMPNTKTGGDISFIPPMDSVQEFRVQTNAYDASIGRQAGATINMQTRAGGKQYHGVLYEYNQNNFLNANLYQNNLIRLTTPSVHFNQFGGTFGGPVWIPKLYRGSGRTIFFVAFDKSINTNPLPQTLSLPTALERQGDFSKSFITQLVNGNRVVYPIKIYNPYQIDSKGNRKILSNPFRSGLLAPTGIVTWPAHKPWPEHFQLGRSNLNRMYSWEYSLHLQQQYGQWLFEIGYSHNKTYNIPWSWSQNLPSFDLWKQLQQPVFDSNGRPGDILRWNTLVPNPFYQLPGVTGTIANSKNIALNQLLNPIPILTSGNSNNITQNRPTGKNGYDVLQTKIERRYSNGLSLIVAFTWSKLFEDTSFLGPQIAGPKIEHKLGGEDRPYVLALTGIWDLPFGRGRRWGANLSGPVNLVVGGWEITGNYSASSGVPVVFSTDSFYTGQSAALDKKQRTRSQWFDTNQFVAFPTANTDISNYPSWTGVQSLPGASYKPPANDTIRNGVYQDFATYIRNYPTRWGNIRQQGVSELVMGFYKNFTFTQTTRLQLRFDAFNALNNPRFGPPNTNPGSSNFGAVTLQQVNQARTIELGGKLYF